jgi:hypothetical protein
MPDYSDIIEKHARRVGLDPGVMKKIMQVESGGDTKQSTGKREHYKGLFQLDREEFARHGGTGDRSDPEQNTMAAANMMARQKLAFKAKYGRDPTPTDTYMIHQQGAAGYNAHLANPDAPAWENFKKASGWSDKMAKQAIWGNMTPAMKAKYGSVENVPSKGFVNEWGQKIEKDEYQPSSDVVATSEGGTVKRRGQRPESQEPEEEQPSLANAFELPQKMRVPTYEVENLVPNIQTPRVI